MTQCPAARSTPERGRVAANVLVQPRGDEGVSGARSADRDGRAGARPGRSGMLARYIRMVREALARAWAPVRARLDALQRANAAGQRRAPSRHASSAVPGTANANMYHELLSCPSTWRRPRAVGLRSRRRTHGPTCSRHAPEIDVKEAMRPSSRTPSPRPSPGSRPSRVPPDGRAASARGVDHRRHVVEQEAERVVARARRRGRGAGAAHVVTTT